MKIENVMIGWTPTRFTNEGTAGQAALFQHPDKDRRSRPYVFTAGACNGDVGKMTDTERRHFVLSTALGMIVRDGIHPAIVHKTLWPIDEYREALPEDTPERAADLGY